MELFDTHFHYEADDPAPQSYFDSLGENAPDYLMSMGGSLEASERARRFAETIPNAYFAAGIHPSEANAPETAADFEHFSGHAKLRAVGELGLDYYYPGAPRERQIAVFQAFLDFALRQNLPAVVHLRDKDGQRHAYDDAEALLSDFAGRGGHFVVHCYTGPEDSLVRFLELGAMIGVTGIVTFPRGGNVRALLRKIPRDRLLLETDSPYLAPVPFRGRKNNPGLLIRIAEEAAKTRNVPVEELAAETCRNGRSFFHV